MRANKERLWLPGFFPLDFCNFAVNCTFPPQNPLLHIMEHFFHLAAGAGGELQMLVGFFCLKAYRPFKTFEREIMCVWEKVHVVSELLVLHQTKKTEDWGVALWQLHKKTAIWHHLFQSSHPWKLFLHSKEQHQPSKQIWIVIQTSL